MTYTPTLYAIAETPAGTFLAWSNHAGHIGYRTLREHERTPSSTIRVTAEELATVDETVTLSRVAYRLQTHLRHDGQRWGVHDWGTAQQSLRRTELFSTEGPTDAAAREYDARIVPALAAWADSAEGRALVAAGERASAANDLDTATDEAHRAEVALADALDTLRAARDRVAAAGAAEL